jgi:hypothetical protein
LDGLARHGGSPRRRLKPGTVLVRDYQGQRHTVTEIRALHCSYGLGDGESYKRALTLGGSVCDANIAHRDPTAWLGW